MLTSLIFMSEGVNCCQREGDVRMAQHGRENSKILQKDSEVHYLDRDWFLRGMKGAIYFKWEQPSLHKAEDLQDHLLFTYNAILSFLPQQPDNNSSFDLQC